MKTIRNTIHNQINNRIYCQVKDQSGYDKYPRSIFNPNIERVYDRVYINLKIKW